MSALCQSRLNALQKTAPYSITSSAMASSVTALSSSAERVAKNDDALCAIHFRAL
jgi:hypothetical protein